MSINFNMSDINFWEDNDSRNVHLANHLINSRIAIILGAGISTSFGLPSWPDLIKNMYLKKGQPIPTSLTSLEAQAEYFKDSICNGDEIDYKKSIQIALYENVKLDFKNLKNLNTLSAIASLLIASKRGSASNVVTFNFDNILELYLSYYGFVTNSRINSKHWTLNSDINIYHPHGFINAPINADSFSKDIVFDQESYSKIIGDESNLWRQHVLSILRTNFCIFIGLSGNDSNFDSFLVKARDTHVAIEEGQLFWGMSFILKGSVPLKGRWNKRGIYAHEISSFEDDSIAEELLKICQKAAQIRMQY